ncbi:hypothetical protein MBCUT_09430 [Methanobrevibacter cuticularis]|uniref:HIT domain-containing protein n=1 Tax=Methanobrevibacter cuticularis TaxID=47311 RepID=A0A166E4A6_9EURY|nr:HIT family protein [Methanobrevibacter cuticularis]KZX16265.1 hypothetical protein MBCUT_09430 [Methanobrevibacter cuticularis]
MKSCEFAKEHELYGELIITSRYWELFLAPSQRYLGTCVLKLKRDCPNLRDLNTEEWCEFTDLVKNIEEAIIDVFNPDLFNWSCFKNASFRKSNPKPQIHWHIHPRYENPVFFEGLKFEDPDFGYIPRPITEKIPKNIQTKMLVILRERLAIDCE